MKTKALVIVFLTVVLVSCAPASTPMPTSTATDTPQPTATFTPEPTATPVPLILGALNPYLTGVGEHGAMVCLRPDASEQLEDVTLKANIIQAEKVLDRNVPSEQVSEYGICFEVIDAKYKVGLPVSVELNATASGLRIANGEQTVELGNYAVFPFIQPLFRQSEIAGLGRFVDKNHTNPSYTEKGYAFYAHDLWFGANGTSDVNIYMPFTSKINWVETQEDNIWRIILTNPYTGYRCLFEHVVVTNYTAIPLNANMSASLINFSKGWTVPYDDSIPIASIGAPPGMLPHLHFECQNPNIPLSPDKSLYDKYFFYNGYTFVRASSAKNLPFTPGIEIAEYLLNGWTK